MINKLKKKVFWMMELLPLCVLFLVLIVYNLSYISFTLSDEKEVLDYCTTCVENHTETLDEYLYLPTEEIAKARESSSHLNNKVKNLLYAVISSDLCVVKTDLNGKILQQTDNTKYLDGFDIKNYTGEDGKFRGDLYSVVTKGNVKYLILLDTTDWFRDILKCMGMSCLGLIFAALVFAAVSLYLSKKIVRPVEEALVKQNQFISDASHELKTPISVINANIAVLEHEYGENKWMGYVKEEGHKMNQLINELLSLCRLDHDMSERTKSVPVDPFQMYDAIMEAVLPFDSIAFEKNVTISTKCSEDLRSKGSREDFQKIITILTDNAVTHVNFGGEIGIQVKHVKSALHVTVSNTGSVISEQDLPFIFERFYKAKGSAKTPAKSSAKASAKDSVSASVSGGGSQDKAGNFGLGLSIAKALCEKNGFTISARSKDGNTYFTVVVPYL